MTRWLAGTAASAALLLAAPAVARTPPAKTRLCGNLTVTFHPVGEGEAYKIRATRVTCQRARQVARACLNGRTSGWDVANEPLTPEMDDQGRTLLTRAAATITFQVLGGGGCA